MENDFKVPDRPRAKTAGANRLVVDPCNFKSEFSCQCVRQPDVKAPCKTRFGG